MPGKRRQKGLGSLYFVSQFNLHLTIQIPALWPLRPRPAAGLGLASLPGIRSIVSMNRALPSG